MVFMTDDLSQSVIRGVQGIHETWGGVPLDNTALYGIRTYENGSTLAMHVDRASTHVISAILHIARDYGDPAEYGPPGWPIQIVDLDGKHQKVPVPANPLTVMHRLIMNRGSLFVHS